VKVSSLISTVLLTLSLAGAVQAQPAAPVNDNVAPATIVLAHCEASDTAKCGISEPVAKESEVDLNALPSGDRKRVQVEQATPVPEPQTFVMLMLGLVVLGFASRRTQSTDKFLKD
jgi:hypothetical protein